MRLALLIVRGVLLLALIAFYLFWFLPSMRQLATFNEDRDRVFGRGEACWNREYNAKNYDASSHCYDEFEAWIETNDMPELGIYWPWTNWHPKEIKSQ
jgi:hypothetical protein